MIRFLNRLQDLLDYFRALDFLAPLALRLYLAPIFIMAGYNKMQHPDQIAAWFEGIGIPAPGVMVWLAALSELLGGLALLIGFATRWFTVPLMVTMVVAAVSVHWENGWHVLPETQLTVPWEWRADLIEGAEERKEMARSILREHGNYEWLTETGSITILKNGIEFAATYFIMLLTLFFIGAGRFFSVDYWLARTYRTN